MNCALTKYQLAALNPHNWLFEEYSKTDTKVFESLVDLLLQVYTGKASIEELYKLSKKARIGFVQVAEDTPLTFCFDPNCGMTIIPIQKSQIRLMLVDESYKQRYLKYLKYEIVHEDTHKQQFDRYEGYSENYKNPSFTEYAFNLATQADIDYFSQTIEADAYGRQVGELLKQEYEDKSVDWIFENVIRHNIPDDIDDLMKVYRDPRISKKGFQHFWRALYDYLKGNEKGFETTQLF